MLVLLGAVTGGGGGCHWWWGELHWWLLSRAAHYQARPSVWPFTSKSISRSRAGCWGTGRRWEGSAASCPLPAAPAKPLSLPRLLEELEGLPGSAWRPAAPSPSKPQQLHKGQTLPCHTREVPGPQWHRVSPGPGAAWPSPAPHSPPVPSRRLKPRL